MVFENCKYSSASFPALAMFELSRIGQGVLLADIVVKKAAVTLLDIKPVSPGKVLVIFGGDVASVEESCKAVRQQFGEFLIDHLLIENIHPDLLGVLSGKSDADELDSLCILETDTASGIIQAADTAAKSADVTLLNIRLSGGIGGKGIVTFTGSLDNIEAAAGEAEKVTELLDKVIIPAPHTDLNEIIIREWSKCILPV